MTLDQSPHPQPEPVCISDICTLIKDTLTASKATGYVLGISGGIDSAVAAALLVQAIGADRVTGLFLPSSTTPRADYADVDILCAWLGISLQTHPLDPILSAYQKVCTGNRYAWGNMTSRIRMSILYMYANEHQRLVCGTSNKTEWYIGYFTKYGDFAADIQPIIHLFKDEIYALARYLGVPSAIIEKVPSAGLYEGQTDEADLHMTYAQLNTALRSLETNNWAPYTDDEKKALELYKASAHKRLPVPHVSPQFLD
jgi:NAD+ synthase